MIVIDCTLAIALVQESIPAFTRTTRATRKGRTRAERVFTKLRTRTMIRQYVLSMFMY